MLRRFQRLRSHIRYHSAPRSSDRWSRAMDIAFMASFLLATPAAVLSDAASRQSRLAISLPGILARNPAGAIDAWLTDANSGRGANPNATPNRGTGNPSETIIGNFNLNVDDELRGWPLVTTIARAPARLNIDIIAEVGARLNVKRDPADPYQFAIGRAVEADDQHEALAAWNLDRPQTRRQWWAWLPAIGAWWIMLFAVAAISIQSLRFASLWMSGRRMHREYARRNEGRCVKCGYDMTGLEFNEKCPECGAQVW